MDTDVLVVGAGPTGLVLALWLRRLGVRVRIIDKGEGPGKTSRALVVHARNLEFYQQMGYAEELIAAGIKLERITVREKAERVGDLAISNFGKGLSPFPFVLALPQDVHERMLIAWLEREGVGVERGTALSGFVQATDRVVATLERDGRTEVVEAQWLCGADGAHSTVRHGLGVGFQGGKYPQVFYVADLVASGAAASGGLDVCMNREGFALVMPVRQSGSVRVIGIVPHDIETREHIAYEDVAAAIVDSTGLSVQAVNWFSTYRISHRVADHFRVGRAFLLGDAGHIHSPAGGQGMNTGIGDAVNLAWKLAAVVQGRADAELLDSYEPERIAFARRLVKSTDRLFRLIATRSMVGGVWREKIVPRIVPLLSRLAPVIRYGFRSVSQIEIAYRQSPISSGIAGRVRAGDRLPWISTADRDNFAPLASFDWQVHVYGEISEQARRAVAKLGLALHVFPYSAGAEKAGLAENALYLVRPDGHVAVCDPRKDVTPIERFCAGLHIALRMDHSASLQWAAG